MSSFYNKVLKGFFAKLTVLFNSRGLILVTSIGCDVKVLSTLPGGPQIPKSWVKKGSYWDFMNKKRGRG